MSVHVIRTVQQIPASVEETWSFFSNPANLQKITPAYMDFRTISKYHGDTIYAGQVIEYRVRPLLGIPVYWMTEITHVKAHEYFVDEQRVGPYSLWHHQHHFRKVNGGVEMTDIVHYKMPFWILGEVANTLLVRQQLQHIFDYRRQQVESAFGAAAI